MGNKIGKAGFITILVLLVTAVLSLVFHVRSYFITMINMTFLASLILLMVGGAMFVLEGGIFNGIIHSFKQFFKKSSQKQRYAAEFIDDDDDDEEKEFSFSFTLPLLISGTFLFIVSLFFSYFV